ncbi:hypothetical protein AWB94_14240 [Mycolicibacterium canariasense]|nr:hypothetical protein AWB94_14240 [Mycolicibacterium canariasense]
MINVDIVVTPRPVDGRCAPLSIAAEELPTLEVHRHACVDPDCSAARGQWAVITVPVSDSEADRLMALGTN